MLSSFKEIPIVLCMWHIYKIICICSTYVYTTHIYYSMKLSSLSYKTLRILIILIAYFLINCIFFHLRKYSVPNQM